MKTTRMAGHHIPKHFVRGREVSHYRELLPYIMFLFGIILIGTLGYAVIEGWDVADSMYMTIITLSTVGFQEIHELSPGGRLFTIVLIVVGVGAVMGVLGVLARVAIDYQFRWLFEGRKMFEEINSLRDHVIFCGFGRFSQVAIHGLEGFPTPLVIVDRDEEMVQMARDLGYFAIKGDASTDEVLLSAGVERASRLVSLLPKDSDNLYVILTCRELNPDLYIISRAEDEVGEKRIKRAGANRIISPYRVGGNKVADGLLRPHVMEFLDLAASSGQGELQIEEILIPDNSPIAGATLQGSNIRKQTNIIVAAIISSGGKMEFNPSGEKVVEAGATLIGLGLKEDFTKLQQLIVGE